MADGVEAQRQGIISRKELTKFVCIYWFANGIAKLSLSFVLVKKKKRKELLIRAGLKPDPVRISSGSFNVAAVGDHYPRGTLNFPGPPRKKNRGKRIKF